MRRTILFAFFLLAACGGGVRSTDAVNRPADTKAARQAYLLTAQAQSAIAAFVGSFSEDAIDTCLNAWIEESAGPTLSNEPVAKPDVAGLRGFLAQCLGGDAPGNVRPAGTRPVAARSVPTGGGELRMSGRGDQ